jgi:hypothetical protein
VCQEGRAFAILRGVFQKDIRITNRDTILSNCTSRGYLDNRLQVRHIDKDKLGCAHPSFVFVFHDTTISCPEPEMMCYVGPSRDFGHLRKPHCAVMFAMSIFCPRAC